MNKTYTNIYRVLDLDGGIYVIMNLYTYVLLHIVLPASTLLTLEYTYLWFTSFHIFQTI